MRENRCLPVNHFTNDRSAEFWEASDASQVTTQECATLQRMRWFLLILLAIGFLASTAIGIIAFLLTKNPYTLAVIPTPTLLIRSTASALLPLDTRRFHLAILKLQSRRAPSPKIGILLPEEPSE